MHYVAVPGTWAIQDRLDPNAWWQPHSDFTTKVLGPTCWTPLREEPFLWSTDVDGIRSLLHLLPAPLRSGDHTDWYAGGEALLWYCDARRPLSVIAHSHGGQVVAYACAAGLKIDHLITVASPVRADVPWKEARRNIGHWTHLHATTGGDRMQWLGSIGDGVWRVPRKMPLADINHGLPNVGHSKVFTPEYWHLWASQGWLETGSCQAKS